MRLDNRTEENDLLKRILRLSWCISYSSPPMKPFTRFSRYAKEKPALARFFWDFDDLLQKKLLDLAYEIASPDTIVRSCIEQWERNLEALHERQKEDLKRAIRDNTEYPFHFDHRTAFVTGRMGPGERLLYVGCGSGKQCFHFAKKGLRVVGIDTTAPLLDIARRWATYLGLPACFICMDITKPAFEPGSFNGFLLEFYGSLPSLSQTLLFQRDLAGLLHPDGQGFVIAWRKKYGSYWFRMGSRYSPVMTSWLIPHAFADFFFSEADNCEERLICGLYNRAHTVQSLFAELSHTFEVTECFYEKDPRYVIAVVRRKEGIELCGEVRGDSGSTTREMSPSRLSEIRNTLAKIEALCDQLEAHAEQVIACFRDSTRLSTDSCLEAISFSPDISEFMNQLMDILSDDPPALGARHGDATVLATDAQQGEPQ